MTDEKHHAMRTENTVRYVADAVVALKKAVMALCVLTDNLPMPDSSRVILVRSFNDAKGALWELSDALHSCARGPKPAEWLDDQ